VSDPVASGERTREISSLKILALCTGNVARSVMLGYMLTSVAETNGLSWRVRTAGTHVVEGSAMSSRTRDALLHVDGLGEHHYGAHRSHQITSDDVAWADAVLACEANHVRYVRTNFESGAARTVTLGQFLREAPLDVPFQEQLRFVSSLEPLDYFDVADPAGKDQAAYDECASELWEMAQAFGTLVVDDGI
jgi:protein-tyrosine-phosphatase